MSVGITVFLEQVAEFVGCEIGLPQDGSQRAGWQVAVAVHRDYDQTASIWAPQAEVAPAHVRLLEPGAAQCLRSLIISTT